MAVAGKFNIQVGSLKQSQMTAGDRNAVGQRAGLSPEKVAAVFAELKATIAEQIPGELRDEALAQAEQLEQAIVCEQPNRRTVRGVLRWFRVHAPQLAGTVSGVLEPETESAPDAGY